MNNKVILVVLDGLNYQVARDCMGYLNGLIEQQRATLYSLQCELPSMSRPLYECLMTGVRPVDSGIVNNQIVRLSHFDSIFSLAKSQGKTTAAAAYHWVARLLMPFVTALLMMNRSTFSTAAFTTGTIIPMKRCFLMPSICACVISRTFC